MSCSVVANFCLISIHSIDCASVSLGRQDEATLDCTLSAG